MTWTVVLATAPGEGALAEAVAGPLRGAGYAVWHEGEVLVGESLVEEAARALMAGGPVVLCGTVRAVGTRFARRLVRAAQARSDRVRVFPLLMDSEADVESLTFAERVADYWRDPAAAMDELLAALAAPSRTRTTVSDRRRYARSPRAFLTIPTRCRCCTSARPRTPTRTSEAAPCTPSAHTRATVTAPGPSCWAGSARTRTGSSEAWPYGLSPAAGPTIRTLGRAWSRSYARKPSPSSGRRP
ncbi:toll/interleukin-1 receptor domain-containing protein [Frankia sp. AgB1.9]|nr:toll/interleukin-1 receptor domain-containing protein [Frankia sp. AgW1.1]MBL7548277.1 toll/interleukin-1 receptor domain-containing protein [Frankia sp. AgB1.9]MBL7618876.1 toll/interleukin-1 receptor domain-containing protein [Frankia sp. AgB1.8]